jgi:hypothetical protein
MRYLIWYALDLSSINPIGFDKRQMVDTHAFLIMVEAENFNHAFHTMQGEMWSPNGEGRPLIEDRGLTHTSMSVGDILESGCDFYMCMPEGWRKL